MSPTHLTSTVTREPLNSKAGPSLEASGTVGDVGRQRAIRRDPRGAVAFLHQFSRTTLAAPSEHGVVSIFPILRTSCAFANYKTEHHLDEAVKHSDGLRLHPGDARCPELLCRIRNKDKNLKPGVGGQRGTGMHRRWIKEQQARAADVTSIRATGVSTSEDTSTVLSSILGKDEPEIYSQSKYQGLSGDPTQMKDICDNIFLSQSVNCLVDRYPLPVCAEELQQNAFVPHAAKNVQSAPADPDVKRVLWAPPSREPSPFQAVDDEHVAKPAVKLVLDPEVTARDRAGERKPDKEYTERKVDFITSTQGSGRGDPFRIE
ncbi:hypothetical protein DXG01_015729 [Tephrocybe rancida]|nr:hypothetical protein DXG01_015729 [Tephrocybe rancida]